jgi:type IV pilus assembly protein PilN
MRNIEASPWLETPVLIETKAVVLDGRRVNEFGMNFTLTRASSDAQTGEGAK